MPDVLAWVDLCGDLRSASGFPHVFSGHGALYTTSTKHGMLVYI